MNTNDTPAPHQTPGFSARPIPQLTSEDARRFLCKVSAPDENGCMIWKASRGGDRNYGRFYIKNLAYMAHRIALVISGRKPLPGQVADHMCKNTMCVNPAHLRWVSDYQSQTENCDSPAAINRRKTVCKNGHPFTPENTYTHTVNSKKCRRCMACHKERVRKYRENQK